MGIFGEELLASSWRSWVGVVPCFCRCDVETVWSCLQHSEWL